MSKKSIFAASAISLLLIAGGLSAAAGQDNSSGSKVYGCVTSLNGNIVFVKTTPHTCPAKTTPIAWSLDLAQGPQGDPGPAGPQGAQGPKGDPGYSYGDALASATDPESQIQAMTSSSDGCTGSFFSTYVEGTSVTCYRSFQSATTFLIHNVKASGHNGSIADSRALYLAPVPCSTNQWKKASWQLKQYLVTDLVSDQAPVKFRIGDGESCLWMSAGGYSSYAATYQVVYSTE